jgi:hypothetical protein
VADSGTILGGFAAPVNIGPALGYKDIPRVPFVALNNVGQAVLTYTPHATLVWNTSSGAFEATEPISLPKAAGACGRQLNRSRPGSV